MLDSLSPHSIKINPQLHLVALERGEKKIKVQGEDIVIQEVDRRVQGTLFYSYVIIRKRFEWIGNKEENKWEIVWFEYLWEDEFLNEKISCLNHLFSWKLNIWDPCLHC